MDRPESHTDKIILRDVYNGKFVISKPMRKRIQKEKVIVTGPLTTSYS